MTTTRSLAWLTTAGAVILAGLLIAYRPQGVSPIQAGLAIGILAVGLAPLVVFLAGKHPAPIPVFPVACLFYAVCFGLPVFLAEMIWPQMDGAAFAYHNVFAPDRGYFLNVQALALVLAGTSLCTVFYYGSATVFPRRMPHLTLPPGDDTPRLVVLLGLLLAGHAAFLLVPAMQRLPSVGQFLGPAGYLAFGGFYWLWRNGRISRRAALLLFALILPLLVAKKLLGGLLTPVIMIGLFFFFLMIYFRSRAALLVAALCAVFVVFGYGPFTEFRLNMWVEPAYRAYSFTEKIEHAFDYREGAMSPQAKIEHSISSVLRRIPFVAMMSHVVAQTPGKIPYWDGETYKPLLTSFIPRAIWPGKPQERIGNAYGTRYGFISDPRTSMNMPWIVEMFVNFGTAGVLVGMSLVGILLAFLDRVFNRPGMGPLEAVVGLTILFPLAYPDSNFSVMTGSLLPLSLALWVYFRVGLTALPGWDKWIAARFGRRHP